jgi:hypothetical protein
MQISKVFVSCLMCLFLCLTISAQTGDRVKNRAENRANQRVDQKVDQAVDRTVDKIEGLFRKKKNTDDPNQEEVPGEAGSTSEAETAEMPSGGIFGGANGNGKFEPYENPVPMSLSMEVTSTNSRGKEDQAIIHFTFDTWATGMTMVSEDGNARVLFDNQDGFMTVISESKGELQGFRMRQPQMDYTKAIPEESEYTITATGNSRVIDGYNCQEYLIESEDATTNSWVTTELDVDMAAMARAMTAQARQAKKSGGQKFYNLKGFPIESTSVSKNGKETTISHFYNVKIGGDIDKSVFDTSGVTITSLGF